MTKKRTDAEMFDAILDHAEMDSIRDEVEAQTDAQIKASLAKDGYTEDKLAEIARKQLSFAAAAAAVIVLGKTDNLPEAFKPVRPIPSGIATGGGPPPMKASDIRDNAYREFFQHRYADCLYDLDTAKRIDPQGDADEAVQSLRTEATARMKQP
jgi:hypothetical protein